MNAIRAHPVATMFLLTFGLTWVVWVPRALGADLGLVGRAWTWAPAVAALVTAALLGKAALRDWAARLLRWRIPWYWYVVVILGPAAFSVVVAGCYALFGGGGAPARVPSPDRPRGAVASPERFIANARRIGGTCPAARKPRSRRVRTRDCEPWPHG